MKDTRPISVQVDELTDEQKENICKVYKWNMIVNVTAMLIVVALVVVSFVFYFAQESAYEKYEEAFSAAINFEKIEERQEYFKDYLDASDAFKTSLFVTIIYSIVMVVVLFSVSMGIKKKYPYYTDKRYSYIKKTRNR